VGWKRKCCTCIQCVTSENEFKHIMTGQLENHVSSYSQSACHLCVSNSVKNCTNCVLSPAILNSKHRKVLQATNSYEWHHCIWDFRACDFCTMSHCHSISWIIAVEGLEFASAEEGVSFLTLDYEDRPHARAMRSW
jgi:hypothetical protein